MIDWSSLEKKAEPRKAELAPPDGPEIIFSGAFCRMVVRTCAEESRRDSDLTRRIYRLALTLLDSEADGLSAEPADGYRHLQTGDASDKPVYVRGADSKEVITTLGRALITASPAVRQVSDALGIRALLEW